MNGSSYKGYLYAGVLAVATVLLVNLTEEIDQIVHVEKKQHSPDYFSLEYVKWEMDEAGRLKSKLIAKTMTHYADDNTTHLELPEMVLIKEATPPWIIRSETGVLSADGQDLLLNGKAVTTRAAGQNVRALTINSSNMRVKPNLNYAETDEWVELLSPPNRTEGVGMKLNYSEPIRIELFSKVRGKYDFKKN